MASSGDLPENENTRETSTEDPARPDRLEHAVAELSGMIAAMQHAPAATAPAGAPVIQQATTPPRDSPGTGRPAEDTLTYSGNVPAGKGARMVISRRHTVEDVGDADPNVAGRVFAALASPVRVTLLKTLLDGPRSTQQLRSVFDDASVGQLYHHLKELLAVGLVVQPGRSVYALRRGSQVELCILILAGHRAGLRWSVLPDLRPRRARRTRRAARLKITLERRPGRLVKGH